MLKVQVLVLYDPGISLKNVTGRPWVCVLVQGMGERKSHQGVMSRG